MDRDEELTGAIVSQSGRSIDGNRIVIKLYGVSGSASTRRALANLRRALSQAQLRESAVLVIDILEEPELAYADAVMATPMLIIETGERITRVVGTLENIEQLHDLFDTDDRS